MPKLSNDRPTETEVRSERTIRSVFPIHGEKTAKPKPVLKGKRATLPLEDKLVLAELTEALTGGVRDKLEGIERQLKRIADCLDAIGKKMSGGEQPAVSFSPSALLGHVSRSDGIPF